MKMLLKIISMLYLLLIHNSAVLAEYGLNMTKGVTELSGKIYDLHMMVFWVCVIIGIVVFGVMFYSIFAHRKSLGAKPANFHESTTIELIWTAVPVLILVLMAIPATKVLIDLEKLEKADIIVKVTGYQWAWQYEYPEEGISFRSNIANSTIDVVFRTSAESGATEKEYAAKREALDAEGNPYLLSVDNNLVLPVGKTIRFLITANDVIHNWWVPALAVKQDANPGFINDAWAKPMEIGIYRGQCAELCGIGHSLMPIVVEVVSQADYDAWIAQKQAAATAAAAAALESWSEGELMAKGENAYKTNCAGCHSIDGAGGFGVAIKGSKIANGDAAEHIEIVLNGRNNMPVFRALGDGELAAVITYQRRAFGNKGSVVQPSDVRSAR